MSWPEAHIDDIGRLRAIAAAYPGVVLTETVFDAPFDAVWGFVSDLERSVATFDPIVGHVRVLDRQGTELRITSGPFSRGPGFRLDVRLEEGFCLMQSPRRLYLVGMAAVPDGDRTRYAHAEGIPRRHLGVARRLQQRLVRADVEGIRRSLRGS